MARTDCALLQHWPAPASALSMDTQLHTHSSPHLTQGQHPIISTYLFKLPIAEIHCIVVCSLHARWLRIILKLPIAEIHSITVCTLHARRNWDTLTVCSLTAGGRAVFILRIPQFQCLLINQTAPGLLCSNTDEYLSRRGDGWRGRHVSTCPLSR